MPDDYRPLDRDLCSILLAKFGVSSRLWESDVYCLAAMTCSKVTPFFWMNVRNSSVAVAWIWLLYSHVRSSIFFGTQLPEKVDFTSFMVMALEMDVKRQKCRFQTCAKVLNHKCFANRLNVD